MQTQGWTAPTAIQTAAIPLVAKGFDVAAEAQTGSGKTGAFVLPILSTVPEDLAAPHRPQTLVLAPTRELALQVASVFKSLSLHLPVVPRVLAVIGGESIDDQRAVLKDGVEVVVATPGRLIDLVERGAIELDDVRVLVLDEADKLLDLGFADELSDVIGELPSERQTLLFSATLPPKVLGLAERVLHEPVLVRIDDQITPVEGIAQRVFQVDRNQRRGLLQHLVSTEEWGQTLVFVATQRATENLAAKLRRAGHSAAALHGGLEQPERVWVLKQFRSGSTSMLIATDIAARGIDVPRLAAVVNFDLPRSPRDYVHRIGRTGRAGESGLAVSFVDHDSEAHFRLIEKRAGIRLERQSVSGFELTGEAPAKEKGVGGVKGKRKSKKDKLREKAAREAAGES